MAVDLQGRVAVVTGGGTGLGREVALQLAAAGCDVAVNYSRSAAEATATAADVRALGRRAMAVQADVASKADVDAMMAAVAATLGRLDVLVCSAGSTVFVPYRDLEGISEADWDRIYAVNVKGPWFCARAAAPHMRRRGGGRIVNVASLAGTIVSGSSLAYATSKAALLHLTRMLAVALAPDDILVNAVAPGLLDTRWIAGFSDADREGMRLRSPLKRIPTVADTAAMVVLLCRTDSITGQAPVIDAGNSLR